jgi:hypothetical protein
MQTEMERAFIEKLNTMANGLGQSAPVPGNDLSSRAKLMQSAMEEIEHQVEQETTATVEYALAIAFRNYGAWYTRGDDRKPYLQRVILHLNRAVALESNHIQAKIELARMLIDEKQVRDLEKGLGIAEELSKNGSLPDWMDSTVQKAKRWKDKFDVRTNNDFSKVSATPAVLREERIKLRKILGMTLKENDITNARAAAMRLYNLAILVAALYGKHDCNSGVSGIMYDSAEKRIKKVTAKLSYEYLGRIEGAEFLSNTDYSRIEKVLGLRTTIPTIEQIERMIAQ